MTKKERDKLIKRLKSIAPQAEEIAEQCVTESEADERIKISASDKYAFISVGLKAQINTLVRELEDGDLWR